MAKSKNELKADAVRIRMGVLKGLRKIGAGHVGGSMSMAEIMAVLYGDAMRVRPEAPRWEGRDWLVVSKGHCGPAVYSTLALHGFFPEEELETVNRNGTRLPSHCDRNKTPGVDMTTGSLGQGMSTAIGVAFGLKHQGKSNRAYLILGDGELQEGQVWEGALFAAHYGLGNLTAFVDHNGKQLDGYTSEINNLGDVAQKFRDFGWLALDCDGNDVDSVREALRSAQREEDRPSLIVAHTVKGLGCTFTEDVYYNHHVRFSEEEYGEAMERLQSELAALEKEGVQ